MAEFKSDLKSDLKSCLQEALDGIQGSGSFAFFRTWDNPINPCLYTPNTRDAIGVPLSDLGAQAIKASSRLASSNPTGASAGTSNPRFMGSVWELSATEFEVQNPRWEEFLLRITEEACEGLGISPTARQQVTAQLYKLSLREPYGVGSLIRPLHEDPLPMGMFGQLIITLQSKHKGGELHVTHGTRTRILEPHNDSAFAASYFATFNSCNYKLKPILSGRSLVLVYQLIHPNLGLWELEFNMNQGRAQLDILIPEMNQLEKHRDFPVLAYLLQNQYPQGSLRCSELQGRDQHVISQLLDAGRDLELSIYLANIEHAVYELKDKHCVNPILYPVTNILDLVECDGFKIAQDIFLPQKWFLSQKAFESIPPDAENVVGIMGQTDNPASTYCRTAVIIVRKDHRTKFFHEPVGDIEKENEILSTWICQLSCRLRHDIWDRTARTLFRELYEILLPRMKKASRTKWYSIDYVIRAIITQGFALGDKRMFLEGYDLCRQYSDEIVSGILPTIGIAIRRFDLESLLPRLSVQLSSIKMFSERSNVLRELAEVYILPAWKVSRKSPVFTQWLKDEFLRALEDEDVTFELPSDGVALASVTIQFPEGELPDKIQSLVKNRVDKTSMVLAFLAEMASRSCRAIPTEMPPNTFRSFFSDIVSEIADSLSILELSGPPGANYRGAPSYLHDVYPVFGPTSSPIVILDPATQRNFAVLLCCCHRYQLHEFAELIITNMVREAQIVSIEQFISIHLPFLKTLANYLPRYELDPKDPIIQEPFQQLLSIYILRYVELEPGNTKSGNHGAWAQRCKEARGHLSHFMPTTLEALLDCHYLNITSLDVAALQIEGPLPAILPAFKMVDDTFLNEDVPSPRKKRRLRHSSDGAKVEKIP